MTHTGSTDTSTERSRKLIVEDANAPKGQSFCFVYSVCTRPACSRLSPFVVLASQLIQQRTGCENSAGHHVVTVFFQLYKATTAPIR